MENRSKEPRRRRSEDEVGQSCEQSGQSCEQSGQSGGQSGQSCGQSGQSCGQSGPSGGQSIIENKSWSQEGQLSLVAVQRAEQLARLVTTPPAREWTAADLRAIGNQDTS